MPVRGVDRREVRAMSATKSATKRRLDRLEEELRELRIECRAYQISFGGKSGYEGLARHGYAWCYSEAMRQESSRERAAGEKAIAHVDMSDDAIVAAVAAASAQSSDGTVRALNVSIALMPEVAETDMTGRHLLVARVGKRVRDLVTEGRLVQAAPPKGRQTARYALPRAVAS